MRGRPHSEETRAAVMAALLAGQGVAEIARAYRLRESTVRTWRGRLAGPEVAAVRAKKGDEFGELLAAYLRQLLTTLSAQAEHARDGAWLEKQDAGELAVLHGVMVDKTLRILEAAERAGEAGRPP